MSGIILIVAVGQSFFEFILAASGSGRRSKISFWLPFFLYSMVLGTMYLEQQDIIASDYTVGDVVCALDERQCDND